MKKNLVYLLGFIFALSFIACDNDDEKDDNNNGSVSTETLSAKWEIADVNSEFKSFEFNEDGTYIVVIHAAGVQPLSMAAAKASFLKSGKSMAPRSNAPDVESNLSPVHTGNYQINGNTITLSGFGLIEVISITNEEFTFSFTLEATGDEYSFEANKAAEPIASSSRTDTLCRTWVIDRITDVDNNDIEEDYVNGILNSIVLFSKAGTYLVMYADEAKEAGLSEWKWANSEETELYYSWDNWEDGWDDNIVRISELTPTSLVIDEGERLTYLRLQN
jgi:hypothetical protein